MAVICLLSPVPFRQGRARGSGCSHLTGLQPVWVTGSTRIICWSDQYFSSRQAVFKCLVDWSLTLWEFWIYSFQQIWKHMKVGTERGQKDKTVVICFTPVITKKWVWLEKIWKCALWNRLQGLWNIWGDLGGFLVFVMRGQFESGQERWEKESRGKHTTNGPGLYSSLLAQELPVQPRQLYQDLQTQKMVQ